MDVTQTVLALLATQPHDDGLRGTGVGAVAYRGIVRKALSPEEAIATLAARRGARRAVHHARLQRRAAAGRGIVTIGGGPLSHAAVLARELGIAAVVGASWRAWISWHDGMLVEVDPVAGQVRILERQPVVPA